MQIQTDGLVLTEHQVGDADRVVSILTRKEGLIRAFAPSAKRIRNSKLSSTQLLSYSDFIIYKGKKKNVVNDAAAKEVFFDLRKDLESISLAQYFCDLMVHLAPEETEAESFLRLILNALYFLMKRDRSPLIIKAAFEMRILSLAGYMPNLVACDSCGTYETDPMYFLPSSAILVCKDCIGEYEDQSIRLPKGVLTGLRHTIYADFEKLYSFNLKEEGLRLLSEVTETYLQNVLGKRPKTLDFYHQIAGGGEYGENSTV